MEAPKATYTYQAERMGTKLSDERVLEKIQETQSEPRPNQVTRKTYTEMARLHEKNTTPQLRNETQKIRCVLGVSYGKNTMKEEADG